MNELMEQIKKKDARAFTHGGKFHADDVFSAALLFYINPEITILRGNRVPVISWNCVLILEEVRMTTSEDSESGKTVCHTLLLVVVGGVGQRSLGKSWRGV